MSTVSAQHSANILPAQWDAFEERLEHFHPDETYSAEQKEFLANLMNEDGHMKSDSKFTWTMIRDELCALLPFSTMAELAPFNSQSVEARRTVLMNLRGPLSLNLNARQEAMTIGTMNASQTIFRWIEFTEDAIPLSLLLDLGWCLGFRHQPRSNSWLLAGKAYILGQVCRALFLDLNPLAGNELHNFGEAPARDGDNYEEMLGPQDLPEPAEEPAEGQGAVAGDVILTYVANATTSSILKLCVHYTWHKKYTTDGAVWSPTHMLADWLIEAKALFTEKTGKTYSAVASVSIHHTAENTWLTGFNANARIPVALPPGEWSDALQASVPGQAPTQRQLLTQWIRYFCIAIVAAKIEPPRIAKRLSVGGGTSTSAQSRRNVRQAIGAGTAPAAVATAAPGASDTAPATAGAGGVLRSAFDFQARFAQQAEADRLLIDTAIERENRKHDEILTGLREISQTMIAAMRELRQPAQQYNHGAPVYHTPVNTFRLAYNQ